jgi:hypothetical protein
MTPAGVLITPGTLGLLVLFFAGTHLVCLALGGALGRWFKSRP